MKIKGENQQLSRLASRILTISLLVVCTAVSANETDDSASASDSSDLLTNSLPIESSEESDEPQAHQILCIKQKRNGSRVVQRRCQTLAQWKQEIAQRQLQTSAGLRARGRAAGWEFSP